MILDIIWHGICTDAGQMLMSTPSDSLSQAQHMISSPGRSLPGCIEVHQNRRVCVSQHGIEGGESLSLSYHAAPC